MQVMVMVRVSHQKINANLSKYPRRDIGTTVCVFICGERKETFNCSTLQFNLPDGEIKLYSATPPGPDCLRSCVSVSEQMNQTNSS